MRIDIITLFPDMMLGALSYGVLSGGIKKGLLSVNYLNPRSFAEDNHKTIDDRPFGGGDGMIMMYEPLKKTLDSIEFKEKKVIYFSPQGKLLTDELVKKLAQESELILLCGRYGGVDQRLLNECVNLEISIGDYVVSGGELPALVFLDALSRQIPGVLGHCASAQQDSFGNGLLEHPQFTRPRCTKEGGQVPSLLLSGDHLKIEKWKHQVSLLNTFFKRKDLYDFFLMKREEEGCDTLKMKQELKLFWNNLSLEELESLGFKGKKFE